MFTTRFAAGMICLLPLAVMTLNADDAVSCKQTDEILSELRELRKLVESATPKSGASAPAPVRRESPVARVDLTGAPFQGDGDAPVTMVEFTDFQCPFCNRFFKTTFQELKKNYIDSGKVRYYSINLPLDMHRNALRAAEAARCAAEQGQFWPMHDRMQGNPQHLELTDLQGYAQDIGIDVANFRQCIETEKYKDDIQRQAQAANKIGAQGTPAFVIGKSTPDGVEGQLIVGAQPYATFEEAIKEASH